MAIVLKWIGFLRRLCSKSRCTSAFPGRDNRSGWPCGGSRGGLRRLGAASERTGNYHLPIKRAFGSASWRDGKFDTRFVHLFATKQHHVAANPGVKTDDNNLAAMFRATVAGYGLVEETFDPLSWKICLLSRHRRDLVKKRSALCCQIREHLDAVLPG